MSVLVGPTGLPASADESGVMARITAAATGVALPIAAPTARTAASGDDRLLPQRGARTAEEPWGDFGAEEPPAVPWIPEEPPVEEPVDSADSPAGTLLTALGVAVGDDVLADDVRKAAEVLGLDVGGSVDEHDVERLIDAHKQRLSPFIRRLGFGHGSRVVDEDVVRFAHKLGVNVGQRVDPIDVERVRRELSRIVAEREPTKVFASLGGVHLHVPTRNLLLIGFHEAAYGVARQMRPHDGNAKMMTLPTRSRPTGSRSAADVAVKPGTQVLSPVSGTVVGVEHYSLYGKYPDSRVRIVSSQNPGMLVSVLHVTGPNVKVGQKVEGGRTVIARAATLFPFESQIDRFAGRAPHAHVEIRRR